MKREEELNNREKYINEKEKIFSEVEKGLNVLRKEKVIPGHYSYCIKCGCKTKEGETYCDKCKVNRKRKVNK